MVYKKIQNEQGSYIDAEQVRWDILEAHEAYTPEGKNVGWDEFESFGCSRGGKLKEITLYQCV